MRVIIFAAAAVLSVAPAFAPAFAQTAGTVFPTNQDAANRPAEQTMQQVGGSNDGPGVNVQNLPVRAPPKVTHTVTTRKTTPKAVQAKPGAQDQH